MSEDRKCSKPGCGASSILGKACLDRDCPQMWVHYTAHNAEVERLRAALADERKRALEAQSDLEQLQIAAAIRALKETTK